MGNVTKRKPPVAAATAYELDPLYRVKRVIAPSNRITVYAYDEDSNTLKVDPPQGASTTHKYDKLGRLRFTDCGIHDSEHHYDAVGNVTWSKSNLTVSTFEYDSLSRLTREQRTGAGHTNYSYYPDSSLKREERWGEHVESTEYQYDSRGSLSQSMRSSTGAGTHDVFSYNLYTTGGQLRETWRESADQTDIDATTYEYDKRGRMTVSTRLADSPDQNATTQLWYDNAGNRVGMTDPNGNNTYFEYDSRDRLICTRDHSQNVTAAYDYNDDGQRTKVLVPNPQGGGLVVQQEFTYNAAGELEHTTSPADNSADECHYDSAGNITRRIDAEGNFVEYEFDQYNRVVAMHEHPTMQFPFPPGQGADEAVPTLDDEAIVTRYEYDQNGNRSKVIDPRGNEYEYVYNALNQLTCIKYPPVSAGKQETYEYDLLGNLTKKTDPNGQESTYFYDGFSRSIREEHHLNGLLRQRIERTYDAAGNLASIKQTEGLPMEILYSYNALNQTTGAQWNVNGVPWKDISYGYDLAGNRALMTGPEGEQVSYGYDPQNRLTSITRVPSESEIEQGIYPEQLTCTFEYDPAGRRKQMVLANGVSALYNYDQKGRLENLRWSRSTGDTIASFSYCYNQIDNIMRKRLDHLNCDFDYAYNRVSWLTSEVCSGNANVTPPPYENQFAAQAGGNESAPSNEVVVTPSPPTMAVPAYTSAWTYDNCGNRKSKNSTIFGNADYDYDEENRLFVEHAEEGDIEYDYDNNGNTISRTKQWNSETEQYMYAWNNQMNGYASPQGQTWSYLFTPETKRIAKTSPDGSSEWYIYDGMNVVSEYAVPGGGTQYALAASYIQGLSIDSKLMRLVASSLGSELGVLGFVGDHQQSVAMLVDLSQSVGTTSMWDSWGQAVGQMGALGRYGFVERERDDESTLVFMRKRAYYSQTGRFLSPEPGVFLLPSEHFLYVSNNPLVLRDRTGWLGEHIRLHELDDTLQFWLMFDIVVSDDVIQAGNQTFAQAEGQIDTSFFDAESIWNNHEHRFRGSNGVMKDVDILLFWKTTQESQWPEEQKRRKDSPREHGVLEPRYKFTVYPGRPPGMKLADAFGFWMDTLSGAVVAHEIGHTWGLADEYEQEGGSVYTRQNIMGAGGAARRVEKYHLALLLWAASSELADIQLQHRYQVYHHLSILGEDEARQQFEKTGFPPEGGAILDRLLAFMERNFTTVQPPITEEEIRRWKERNR